MPGLLDVTHFVIPSRVLDVTLETLSASGEHGYEAFVVWGGKRQDHHTLRFEVAYRPAQQSYKTEQGLLVHVDEEALFRLNKEFNDYGLIVAGQAHSHPTDAYHSETDDHRPLVTLLGGLSVVVPGFGLGGRADLDRFAWYRLMGYADWRELDPAGAIVFE